MYERWPNMEGDTINCPETLSHYPRPVNTNMCSFTLYEVMISSKMFLESDANTPTVAPGIRLA